METDTVLCENIGQFQFPLSSEISDMFVSDHDQSNIIVYDAAMLYDDLFKSVKIEILPYYILAAAADFSN